MGADLYTEGYEAYVRGEVSPPEGVVFIGPDAVASWREGWTDAREDAAADYPLDREGE